MSSVRTPHGERRHQSISVNTRDGSEHMLCGLTVERKDIMRVWQEPDCASCRRRILMERTPPKTFPAMRLWRVEVMDDENNYADVLVSAITERKARRLAVAEVRSYGGKNWGGNWKVSTRKDAVVPIELSPARVHAVVPGWD